MPEVTFSNLLVVAAVRRLLDARATAAAALLQATSLLQPPAPTLGPAAADPRSRPCPSP